MPVLFLLLVNLHNFVPVVIRFVQADFSGRWLALGRSARSRASADLAVVLGLDEGVVDLFGSIDDGLLPFCVLGGVEFRVIPLCLDLRGDCNCH